MNRDPNFVPKSRGRPKGSLSKRTLEFAAVLAENNFDVAKALLWTFKEAKKSYEFYQERLKDNRISPLEDKAPVYLRICGDTAREIASYTYPKLKAIDRPPPNVLEGMNGEQKLEAMKQAVLKLELEKRSEVDVEEVSS